MHILHPYMRGQDFFLYGVFEPLLFPRYKVGYNLDKELV